MEGVMQAISNVSVLWGRLAVLLQHPTQDVLTVQQHCSFTS
jgi:hypothetical protein